MTAILLVAVTACSSAEREDTTPHTGQTTIPRNAEGEVDEEIPTDPGRTPNPTVARAAGGRGAAIGGMAFDVTEFGFQEREFLFEGTAET